MPRAKRLPLEQLEPLLVKLPSEPVSLNFPHIFGNDHPVELEVGFGKGLFLLTASETNPQINYLGIEIERKYYLHTATHLTKRDRKNVRLVCADARSFLRDFVPDESFQAVHVYFPDPWWKNRHRKRRLFTTDFVDQCERILKCGGDLRLASDVEDYFQIMTGFLDARTGLSRQTSSETRSPTQEADYLTNFERKYRQEGRAIYRAVYLRQ